MHSLEGSRRRSTRIASGLLCIMLLSIVPGLLLAQAQDKSVRLLVLLGDSSDSHLEVAEHLRNRLGLRSTVPVHYDIRMLAQLEANRALPDPKPNLVVAVGIRASALALNIAGPTPVLSLLVPAQDYAALRKLYRPIPRQRSAIFLDQPLRRQLNLLQLILPDATRVASLGSPQSEDRLQELNRLSVDRGLKLSFEIIANGANPIHPLTRLTEQAEVLLALPDPEVFNRTSVQAILLTTYRSRVPVIGFSRAYVRAGALAAVHSSAQQIGEQAGDWLAELIKNDRWILGIPRYPRYFSVAVNTQVAQSLGIVIPDEAELLEKLQAREAP